MENGLSKRIKQRLFDRNLSQKDLAEGIDISQPQISRLLNGDRGTDLSTIVRIAKFLGDSPVDYVLLYAGLSMEKNRDARIRRIEHLLSQLDERDLDTAEKIIDALSPDKKKKRDNHSRAGA